MSETMQRPSLSFDSPLYTKLGIEPVIEDKYFNPKPKSYNASHRKKVQCKRFGRTLNRMFTRKQKGEMDKLFKDKFNDVLMHGVSITTEQEIRLILKPDEQG